MALNDFQQLLCWQLSHELKCEVLAFTATPPASRDFDFCDQIRNSAAAAPRDIAEGFGRMRPREFARYLEFALGSLSETKASLIDARDRKYLPEPVASRLINLSAAAIRVTKRLWAQKKRQGQSARERGA
jgi:four helix bundle protein